MINNSELTTHRITSTATTLLFSFMLLQAHAVTTASALRCTKAENVDQQIIKDTAIYIVLTKRKP